MANRTFKVYGQAYAASGDVSVVLNVGGVEVFNGAVNDSTTVRNGPPTTNNLLFTYTLDEETTGGLAYSLAVSGGELCLGQTFYNGITTQKLDVAWMEANVPDPDNVSAAAQTHIATTLGESALGTDLYNAMIAGTASNPTDAQKAKFEEANTVVTDHTAYGTAHDTRTNAEIDGTPIVGWNDAAINMGDWPIIADGSTFTCTWALDPATTKPDPSM